MTARHDLLTFSGNGVQEMKISKHVENSQDMPKPWYLI